MAGTCSRPAWGTGGTWQHFSDVDIPVRRFAVLAVFLGKARYLKPGGMLMAAGVNLALMLVYYLFA